MSRIKTGSLNFETTIKKLSEVLKEDLPGTAAQEKMAPYTGRLNISSRETNARESGVLILLYPVEGTTKIVLIQRSDYDGVHSGQVGFPGGRRESSDKTIVHTALREAREELSIDPSRVVLLGQLTELYIPPSNSLVTPVVGYAEERPSFVPDEREVAAIIESEVSHFLNDINQKIMDVETRLGKIKDVPYFLLDEYKIWGATAMMLSELSEVLKK